MVISPEHLNQLATAGYVTLPAVMPAKFLDSLRAEVDRLFEAEGSEAGAEYKQEPGCRRLANLVDKGEVFRELIANAQILEYVRAVLGADIKLSSLNARRVLPRCGAMQPLHADMAAIPDEKGAWVCNAVWMLDDFTPENGPLRIIPGSHRLGQLPRDALADPVAPHPAEIVVTGRAGSVVVLNAHVWHGGLANRTERSRTAVHAFYARRDKPQQQYQKPLLRPETEAGLTPELRHLLALDDPLNDRLSRDVAVRSGFMK